MQVEEVKAREQLVSVAQSLYQRGYSHGATGNISVKLDDGWLLSPTDSSLGQLDPARLTKLDEFGKVVSGDPPSKEIFLHQAVYHRRVGAQAVIHLHSGYSVAWSCLPSLPTENALPPLTAYAHMQCGRVALLPYYRPGDLKLAAAVERACGRHWSILLAHHGPVVAGRSLRKAMYAIEELEQTAKLALMLRNHPTELLNPQQLADLDRHFPPWSDKAERSWLT